MQTLPETTTRVITVEEYEQMITAGAIREGERVELLGGEIVTMAAMHLPHANSVENLGYLLRAQVPAGLRVGMQRPILLDDLSEPEPDLFVYRPQRRGTHPLPVDLLLVVEVADSSLDYDRNRKFPRYAAAGIPEAWLFNVGATILERHTEPVDGRYRQVVTAQRGEVLTSTVLAGLTIAVDAILDTDTE